MRSALTGLSTRAISNYLTYFFIALQNYAKKQSFIWFRAKCEHTARMSSDWTFCIIKENFVTLDFGRIYFTENCLTLWCALQVFYTKWWEFISLFFRQIACPKGSAYEIKSLLPLAKPSCWYWHLGRYILEYSFVRGRGGTLVLLLPFAVIKLKLKNSQTRHF